jgi:hypothetical protein
MSDIIKTDTSLSTATSSLGQWFTVVDDPEITASVLANTTQSTYEASPFRLCKTGKAPFFSWSAPSKDNKKDANAIPEITEPIVGLRGYILHSGTRLSLFDSENKKQVCGSVSSVIGYDSDRKPILNKNPYPISSPVYNGRGYSANPEDPAFPNPIIENLKVMGSRGLSCAECINRGEDQITLVPETGPNAGKEVTQQCGASNKIIFCVLQFAIIELNDAGKNEAVWYTPDKYLSRKGLPIIKGPFILELDLGRAQATKKIGPKFAIVTEPHSCVPADAVTWTTYLSGLNNASNRRINIVKAVDPTAFDCDYMFLTKAATEIWCGSAAPDYVNQMIHGWPVFRDWELQTARELNSVMETAFAVYDQERSNNQNLNFFSAEETALVSNTTEALTPSEDVEDTDVEIKPSPSPTAQKKTTLGVDIFRK